MTASKTPRLSLMSPVGSDAFVVGDFSDTFGKIDAQPGILPVPNAAARPNTWTTAQHGSVILQTDFAILLEWNQPSSAAPGSWLRLNGQGFQAQYTNSGSVSTSTRNYASGPVVVSGTFTLPGGRPLLLNVGWDAFFNDTAGKNVLSYWENGTRVWDRVFYGWRGEGNAWSVAFYRNPAPSASASVAVRLSIAAYNASPDNGGGTTTISNTILTAIEI